MKKLQYVLGFIAIALVGSSQTPIIQTKYTVEPALMVYYNDTVSLYAGHDAFGFKIMDWLL